MKSFYGDLQSTISFGFCNGLLQSIFFAFKVLIVFQSQRKKLIENFEWLFEKVHLTNSTFRVFDKKVPDLNFHFF